MTREKRPHTPVRRRLCVFCVDPFVGREWIGPLIATIELPPNRIESCILLYLTDLSQVAKDWCTLCATRK